VRAAAFFGRTEDLEWRQSVFRTEGLTEPEIWNTAREFVERPSKRHLKARAIFACRDAMDVGLHVQEESVPHPRHAVVVGWGSEDSKRRLLAAELVLRCKVQKAPME